MDAAAGQSASQRAIDDSLSLCRPHVSANEYAYREAERKRHIITRMLAPRAGSPATAIPAKLKASACVSHSDAAPTSCHTMDVDQ
jgi:hypothetical protein